MYNHNVAACFLIYTKNQNVFSFWILILNQNHSKFRYMLVAQYFAHHQFRILIFECLPISISISYCYSDSHPRQLKRAKHPTTYKQSRKLGSNSQ